MCVRNGLLGSYVPLFEYVDRDDSMPGEPVSASQAFYVTNVTFPSTGAAAWPHRYPLDFVGAEPTATATSALCAD